MNKNGDLALADLGLSVKKSSGGVEGFSKPVCTLLYQSPEQLFQSQKFYDEKVDIWSLGCIFYELLTGEILFYAKSKDQLIDLMIQQFGTDELGEWEEGKQTEIFKKHAHRLKRNKSLWNSVRSKVHDKNALLLLDVLCRLDPRKRPTANTILNHPFFIEMEDESEDEKLIK